MLIDGDTVSGLENRRDAMPSSLRALGFGLIALSGVFLILKAFLNKVFFWSTSDGVVDEPNRKSEPPSSLEYSLGDIVDFLRSRMIVDIGEMIVVDAG